MQIIIFEHNDEDGPEEVDLEPRAVPPPVHLGKPFFVLSEGYWMIPPSLLSPGSVLVSHETGAGMVLTIDGRNHDAPFGPACDRGRLKTRSRAIRGRKLKGVRRGPQQ